MKKNNNFKNANNYFWVQHWINETKPLNENYEVKAVRYDCYRWICEIELPLINRTVCAISKKEINAILNATNKAAKLINEYIKRHSKLRIKNIYKRGGWIIEGNDDGEVIFLGQSKAGSEREDKKWIKSFKKARTILKKAAFDVAEILGTSKNLFVEVFDSSVFRDMSSSDARKKLFQFIDENYDADQTNIAYDMAKEKIVVIGFANIKEEEKETESDISIN